MILFTSEAHDMILKFVKNNDHYLVYSSAIDETLQTPVVITTEYAKSLIELYRTDTDFYELGFKTWVLKPHNPQAFNRTCAWLNHADHAPILISYGELEGFMINIFGEEQINNILNKS
jgi:hypothetical protein